MAKKTISASEKEALRVWGYLVWEKSWKELAPVSNSRAQFLKYVYRDFEKLDDKELQRIENAVVAQTKHWRLKAKSEKLVGIPTLSVWYNQGRYDDAFIDESAASLKDKASKNLSSIPVCSHDGCNALCHGAAYSHCVDHIPYKGEMADRLRSAYRELKIDKSRPYAEQCKEIWNSKLKSKSVFNNIPEAPPHRSREEQVDYIESTLGVEL